jgi:hypothetical protein
MSEERQKFDGLPGGVREYIGELVRRVRYRRRVRREVGRELTDHFVDALGDCESEQGRNEVGEKLVAEFGEAKVLAKLIRRGKKRCRPFWLKALIRTCQVIGIFLLVVGLRAVHLSVGKPNVEVDYVAWLNEKVRGGRDESLNAKPYFDQAVELANEKVLDELSETYPEVPAELTEKQETAIRKFLKGNEDSFRCLRQAVEHSHYWMEYQQIPLTELPPGTSSYALTSRSILESMDNSMFTSEVVNGLLHTLKPYRHMSARMAVQITWDIHQGNYESALQDCLVLQKFGIYLQLGRTIIEPLVGRSVESQGNARMFQVLDRAELSSDDLLHLQKQIEGFYENAVSQWDFSLEKAFWYDYVQRTFTDDGKGGGRMLPRGIPLVVNDYQDVLKGFLLGYPDRREVIAKIDDFFDRQRKVSEKTPWQLQVVGFDLLKFKENMDVGLLMKIEMGAINRVGELFWRLRTERAALLTVLALKRWRIEQGVYPVQLAELIESGYVKQLPKDPYSEGILRYKRQGEDFVLYSVGVDFEDDEGTRDPEELWGWGEEGGDRVFWPLEVSHEFHE